LAKVAVQCSADTFVVNQSLVLRINICGKNRHLRQAPNRLTSYFYVVIALRRLLLHEKSIEIKPSYSVFCSSMFI